MLTSGILLAASFGGIASAATLNVAVGSGGLKFNPASLTAAVGDTIEFDFSSVSHDVVQSSFESPCAPSPNGFYVPAQSSTNAKFTITVNDTNPIYYYCSVGRHCPSGMVGIINPASDKSQSDFANAAKSASVSAPSNGVVGGTFSDGSSSASSSATSASSATGSRSSSASSGSATTSGSGSAASSTSSAGGIPTAIPAALAVVAGAVAAYL